MTSKEILNSSINNKENPHEATALTHILVKGARQHNLKNIDIAIPKNKFIVFTGVSGSGKSSLAMDTIYADGQRRYVESLSSYARQFLGIMEKPDVDSIEGLSPAIAIDQKTTSKNPRSTVGTITEVYDFLRLLFARVGHPHCPKCNREIQRQSAQEIVDNIFNTIALEQDFNTERGVRLLIMSPIVQDRKGEYSALFENLIKQGIIRARIDGQIRSLRDNFALIKTNKHTIEAVISRQIINKKSTENEQDKNELFSNIYQSVETALKLSNGNIVVAIVKDKEFEFPEDPKEFEDHLYSENFACPVCNISLPDIEPRTFSFNSPHGACATCDGLGTQLEVDENLLYNPKLSVSEGGIYPWSRIFDHYSWTSRVVQAVAKEYEFSLDVPIYQMDARAKEILLYGAPNKQRFWVTYTDRDGEQHKYKAGYEGIIPNLERRYKETKSDYIRREIEKYMVRDNCPECNGTRLKKESLSIVIDKKNISQVTDMSIMNVKQWCGELPSKFTIRENQIADTLMREINYRLKFLVDVGLGYLTLSRSSAHLSGGEAQRIRLASQIGSGLSGVLYVLDEPSIGLHQRDQGKLNTTLKHLRDLGNTVVVVEHDMDTMFECDYIFDFGPGAGDHGGKVVAEGTPQQIIDNQDSLTGLYLSGKKIVGQNGVKKQQLFEELLEQEVNKSIKRKISGKTLKIKQASGRNLKNIDFEIPLGKFTCVTGVSGSGKSTLIMDTLYRELRQYYGLKNDERPEENLGLEGAENIDKVIAIDQTPIGRTPKSNPATYTKTFDHIRDLYAQTEEAKVRGYKPGRFSFNVKGGRCEACNGEGQIKIEMQFMPDVYVNCEVCQGKRYNREALEIHYKTKNISDILDMTVEEALTFFENIPSIRRKLQTLHDVGLGYIRLGQPAPTLSGGEAQRVKLALELSKRPTGSTLYILDEPTTGLHFADLERLIAIIKRLTARGNTVIVIEHNLDIISNSDYVFDLGPEGGSQGGQIVFSGTLSQLEDNKSSYTAQALHKMKERFLQER
ncbi:MAG: excinuclease ABC subunit UvrA [Paludibacteraceae bacterium]|nr:excinuclease ABC subunit UvrA [Paludibacteraceae bacterium]